MVTHETFNIAPFWDEEFKTLEYHKEVFNDPTARNKWVASGYMGQFGGVMCDMRYTQPSWNQQFVDFFSSLGWKNIGTSYYRMVTGTMIPLHRDLYKRYVDVFDLKGKEHTIRRAVVFLEEWKSGHYIECEDIPYVNWIKGFTVSWSWDAEHSAMNFGPQPRYTLQVTGHI